MIVFTKVALSTVLESLNTQRAFSETWWFKYISKDIK